MKLNGFSLKSFVTFWFVAYCLLRIVATFGQLYVFSQIEVGKTMALFSATSLIIVNLAGLLLLGEILSKQAYIGVMLAVSAVLVIAFSK